MKIGPFDLNRDVLIVAEIGNNHEGDFEFAKRLIHEAASAGAGAVKFQTIVPERLVSPREKERVRQLERFRFDYEQFEELCRVAKEENVLFLSTPFDLESVAFLNRLVPAFKIASGDNNFFPLIEAIAQTGKPILLSSGMADLAQIKQTKDFIEEIWKKKGVAQDLAILHCVVSYPTPLREANLLAIRELKKLGVTVGYSDHTLGIEATVLSVALGARIIEKHFTLDKNYSDFHDHKIAVDPVEMAQLVRRVREAVELLGDGVKRVQEAEKKNIGKVRRSIAAARSLPKGSILRWEDLSWVRPGGGISPGHECDFLGKVLKRSIAKGAMFRLDDVMSVTEIREKRCVE